MKPLLPWALSALTLVLSQIAHAEAITVTPDNFTRAESDRFFAGVVKQGAFGKLRHVRELMPLNNQTVVRGNRDTLYSSGVFDLDAGPVTVVLPEAGQRFRSLIAIDQDHYLHGVVYQAGRYTFSRAQVGTRYLLIGLRTLVEPTNEQDMRAAHALQDATRVEQAAIGRYEIPDWDDASQTAVRKALLALGATLPDADRSFGTRDQVDPVRHLIGTATAWGGNPEREASYLMVTPTRNDGRTVYRLTVRDVPVDGFWSISVYNADGYFQANPLNAYTLNNLTAKRSVDGSVEVQFGGCDGRIANCLPITEGWNYQVRLYRPRAEILDGRWQFPEAKPQG